MPQIRQSYMNVNLDEQFTPTRHVLVAQVLVGKFLDVRRVRLVNDCLPRLEQPGAVRLANPAKHCLRRRNRSNLRDMGPWTWKAATHKLWYHLMVPSVQLPALCRWQGA